MGKAMLSQDYHDAGKSRAIEVLEEIRDGFLRKARHAEMRAANAEVDEDFEAQSTFLRAWACWQVAADDIATFIQREQR